MGAKRTLLNKQAQGRKPGPLALARRIAPVGRAARMATPFGTLSVNRIFRANMVLMQAFKDKQAEAVAAN